MKRDEIIAAVKSKPEVSVLIVGGGINGIGLYWDLALQGLDVLLVEKADFASGASAASTRMIHGGLRYLENAEFRLVRESVTERDRLLQNAPHYVHPQPITIPIYNWTSGMIHAARKFLGFDSKASERGALVIKAGLTMYDIFTRGHSASVPDHHFESREQSLRRRPQLRSNIINTAIYYDSRISHPERLCLELIMDAEAQSDQVNALNYVSVIGAEGKSVSLRDEITEEVFTVNPTLVINASGAWIDFTNQAMTRNTEMIGGTKGSHLVVDHPDLYEATQGEMLYFANDDGRICIFYPFYDKVIVGSTDIPVGDPDSAVCDAEETAYLVESVNQVFPNIHIKDEHIVFTFCGVRPLPSSKSSTTGQISRDHSFPLIPPGDGIDFGVYSLIGGKWTTFRAFAEQVSETIMPLFDKKRTVKTEDIAIGGGKDFPQSEADKNSWVDALEKETNIDCERLEILLDRYGTYARTVAQFMAAEPDKPLQHQPEYTEREIRFMAQNERVLHIDDVILRRSIIGMLGETTHDLLAELTNILAQELGWTESQKQAEIQRTVELLEARYGVHLKKETA